MLYVEINMYFLTSGFQTLLTGNKILFLVLVGKWKSANFCSSFQNFAGIFCGL